MKQRDVAEGEEQSKANFTLYAVNVCISTSGIIFSGKKGIKKESKKDDGWKKE